MQQQNYILRLESQLAQAEAECSRWKALYEQAKKPPPVTVEGLNAEAWDRWVTYRKEIGKRPYKSTQVQRWLAQYPAPEQATIVTQSISKEWQGLHELKASAYGAKSVSHKDEVYL